MTRVVLAQEAADTGLVWYAYIFWALVLASTCYWIYRAYNGISRRKQSGPAAVPEQAAPAPGSDPLRPPSPSSRTVSAPTTPGPSRPEVSAPTTPGPSEPVAPPPVSSTTAERRTPPAPAPGGRADGPAPTGGRSGLFAPASGSGRPADEPRRTVAKLLEGITMPCDLAPIVLAESTVRATMGLEVTFATNTAAAAQVGSALGDELERLGFALQSVSDEEVQADRDDGRLRVTLVIDPGERKREGRRIYPSLPPDSVVVEFESI